MSNPIQLSSADRDKILALKDLLDRAFQYGVVDDVWMEVLAPLLRFDHHTIQKNEQLKDDILRPFQSIMAASILAGLSSTPGPPGPPGPPGDGTFDAVCTGAEQPLDWVYIGGTSGGNPVVSKVDITNGDKMPAIGVIASKPTNTTAVVCTLGPLSGFSGLPLTRPHYIGLDSRAQSTPPTPPVGGKIYQQTVGLPFSTSQLYIFPNANLIVRKG